MNAYDKWPVGGAEQATDEDIVRGYLHDKIMGSCEAECATEWTEVFGKGDAEDFLHRIQNEVFGGSASRTPAERYEAVRSLFMAQFERYADQETGEA